MVIITITGIPGAGNSTVGKRLSDILEIPYFSMGSIRKRLAEKKGMTMQEFNKYSETDPSSDHLVDEYQQTLHEKHPGFILDAKLGWHFYPNSVKIYLKVDIRESAKRIIEEGRTVEAWKDIEEGVAALNDRLRSDASRYKQLYGVMLHQLNDYDIIIDTTHIPAEEVVEKILSWLKEHKKLDSKPI
ncbi:AAA family ATPase [Candidatus Woesearchaeota archaeon]|nr:AAA family ATPase [Candidatus Woesearchaeota archaeon]